MPRQSRLKQVNSIIKKYVPKTEDIKNVGAEIAKISKLEDMTLNVLLFVDNHASNEASTVVRNLFMTSVPNVRLQICYFDNNDVNVDRSADMAVIVGCDTSSVVDLLYKIREMAVPCYIVFDGSTSSSVSSFLAEREIAGDYCILNPEEKESVAIMKKKLGTWIANVCVGKKFAFAAAFPFVARPLAMEIVHLTAIENTAVGIVPFLSKADFPIMLLNQLCMLGQIATVYGKKIDLNLLKEAAGVLVAAVFGKKVFKITNKIIPLPAFVISGVVALGTTEVIGRALVSYFEAGGDIDGVVELLKKTLEGSKVASDAVKPIASKIAATVRA